MKYLVLVLSALSVFFLASCQNNPTTSGASSEASVNADTLNKQIQYDFYDGRAVSYKYAKQHKETMDFIRGMKSAWGGLPESERQKVGKINEQLTPFMTAFEEHRLCTDKLDSLTIHLSAGSVTPADAQKEYEALRATMLAAAEKLPATQGSYDLTALKAEFEAIFSEANKKAAGRN